MTPAHGGREALPATRVTRVLQARKGREAFTGNTGARGPAGSSANLGTDVTFIDVLTQAQYNAIQNKSGTTLYVIVG